MAERAIKPIHNVFKQYRKVNLVNPYLHSKPFESTWRTSNTSTGSSTSTQIKLPLQSTGSYNFTVDWGDGTSNVITTWNQVQTTHTYSVAGDYTIKITGVCVGWQFNNTGDRLKILSIATWGGLKLGNSGSYFYGCANLNLSGVTDVLNLTGTTSLAGFFRSCSSLTYVNKINEWNTSLCTSTYLMFYMFGVSSTFNQALSFDTSSVTTMEAMFAGCSVLNSPINFNTSNVTIMYEMFLGCSVFNQNIGSWNVSNVIIFSKMFQSATSFNNGGSSSIGSWVLNSSIGVNLVSMFQSASSFNQPIGTWNTTSVTTAGNMFFGATAFNQPLNLWNVGNVTNMSGMFQNASNFNQNIGNWDVSKVNTFSSMFSSAIRFDNGGSSDINNWTLNTATGINMSSMFLNATAFNQPLNSWNTSRVNNMSGMFARSISGTNLFNQNIGNWDVSRVVDFSTMFSATSTGVLSFNNGGSPDINNWTLNTTADINASSMLRNNKFNQPLNLWNTSRITNMSFMFATSIFNQNIGSWNVGNVTNMSSMFASSPFNQDISTWNVSNVTTMASMFAGASSFNQSIGGWDVSKVTNMSSMFSSAQTFNYNISLWNVSLVTNMSSMFQNAVSFNQNIGTWNISNVINFTNFMTGKTDLNYSASNLDAIYNGWSSLSGGVKPSIVISFATIKYTAAGSAGKAILQGAPNNWTITDGGI